MSSKKPVDKFISRSLSLLQRDFIVIGKERVPSFVAWPVMMFLAGVVVTVAFLASRSGTLQGGYAAAAQTFQASTDFSGAQGYKNWYYLDGSGGNLTYIAGGSPLWRGSEQDAIIWPGNAHPGNNTDVVRRWKAPEAGTVNITGTVKDADGGCGDGVNASIKKDATVLWSASVANGNMVGASFNLITSLAGGQAINFVLNKGTDNYCDTTQFDPKIVFTPDTGTPLPDLITNHQDITILGTFNPGTSLRFSSTVKNIGAGTAAAGSVGRWCIDNADCLNTTVRQLNIANFNAFGPGVVSALRTSAAWTAAAGSHTIYWCADVTKVIAESNEGNNCQSKTFTVGGVAKNEKLLYRQPVTSNIDTFAFGDPPPPGDNKSMLILWQQGSDAVSKAVSWDVGAYTGFRPSIPYSAYQRGKVDVSGATAVQVQGRTVGIYSAPTTRPTIGDLVPIVLQHYYPLGTGPRPWTHAASELRMSAGIQVPTASVSNGAVGYVQFSLGIRDTTKSGITGAFWIQTQVFDTRNTFPESLQGDDCPGCTFLPIIGSAVRSGTKYVHMIGGSPVSRGSTWTGFQRYMFGISRAELQKMIADIKNKYPSTYGNISTRPEDYEIVILGVLDEIYYPQGSSASMGAAIRNLEVAEVY